jgi:DNA-binding transcriptional MerR regulator
MRIGELAAASGASPRSLRYYEQQGLISSERSASGQRHYDDATAVRVRLIRSLLAAGLSSSAIYDVLPCITDPDIRTPELERRLRAELERIDEQLIALRSTRETLQSVVEQYAMPALSESS